MYTLLRLVAALLCIAWTTGEATASPCPAPFAQLIQRGSYGVSDLQGKVISGCNLDTPYIPASILKVPTALAGLKILGPDYHFKTRFYTDKQDNLYIMGMGDPLLIPEEIRLILTTLKERGLRRINAIFIDSSNFALEHQVPGSEFTDNAYDAPVGATAVNFNSVPIRVTKERLIVSGEEQTPPLPLMQRLAKGYGPGIYRLNICTGTCRQPDAQMATYTAELFRALQQEVGIPGSGQSGMRPIPKGAKLFYTHHNTKNLQELTQSFLKFSSNFIANLVYLACGAERFGYPATWDKAHRAVQAELTQLLGEHTAAQVIHTEGAGLSRENRMTARAMLDILGAFRPYAHLLRRYRGVPGKSGTLKGIYNYAGYLADNKAYVIMLNQGRNQRAAVLDLLKQGKYLPTKRKKGR